MKKATRVINHNIAEPWWGLRRNFTPCFGARLVQEGTLSERSVCRAVKDAMPVG